MLIRLARLEPEQTEKLLIEESLERPIRAAL
jgi:hypothetical protein